MIFDTDYGDERDSDPPDDVRPFQWMCPDCGFLARRGATACGYCGWRNIEC